jgi:hypothetical protein
MAAPDAGKVITEEYPGSILLAPLGDALLVRPAIPLTVSWCTTGTATCRDGVTLKTGADPFTIPIDEICGDRMHPRLRNVLLWATCSREHVEGSGRRMSNE